MPYPISSGADQDKVLECANTALNKYVGGGLKVRKKPAPRAKPAKAPPKDKQVDTLTAASRKLHNLTSNVTWLVHPENDEYSYTTSVKLANGYPVRNNITRKVVMIALDEASPPLTGKDAKIALSLGLDVDYDSIVL